jgi:hypothetical protein
MPPSSHNDPIFSQWSPLLSMVSSSQWHLLITMAASPHNGPSPHTVSLSLQWYLLTMAPLLKWAQSHSHGFLSLGRLTLFTMASDLHNGHLSHTGSLSSHWVPLLTLAPSPQHDPNSSQYPPLYTRAYSPHFVPSPNHGSHS